MVARIIVVLSLSLAGFTAGMFVAAMLFVEEHPGGGSGNARYGPLWGCIGGSVGAVIAFVAAVLLVRRVLPRTVT